mgnify:CR=1 FL=1
MLIIFALLVLTIIFITLALSNAFSVFSTWETICQLLAITFAVCLIIALASIVCINVQAPSDKLALEAEREIIEYQIDAYGTTSAVNVNELLYTQIRDYNEKIIVNQYFRKNPWTSWFVPSFYEGMETIDYK